MKRTYRSIYQLCYLISLFLLIFGINCIQAVKSGESDTPAFLMILFAVMFLAGAAALASFAWLRMQKLRKQDEQDLIDHLNGKTNSDYVSSSYRSDDAPEETRNVSYEEENEDNASEEAEDSSDDGADDGIYPSEPPSYNKEDYPKNRDLEDEIQSVEDRLKSEE